jgi:L-ascorbate metabolism protein UlaG (beta-lactamase superfamily)
MPSSSSTVAITHIGGPTALLEYGALRLVTDPTFDEPGHYPRGERTLTKLSRPALAPTALGGIDAVLLSHDQHPDNLDVRGREFLRAVPTVLSTVAAADRIPGVLPMEPWATHALGSATVIAVPAIHGSEEVGGPVLGFVLTAPGLPTVYISGDNSRADVVASIVDAVGPIDIALLFAGAARVAGDALALTLTAEEAVRAAELLGTARIVPLHTEGWLHFSEGTGTVARAFDAAGLGDRLTVPLAGVRLPL